MKEKIMELREMMKGHTDLFEDFKSDQNAGIQQPPYLTASRLFSAPGLKEEGAGRIFPLPKNFTTLSFTQDFPSLIEQRISRREYTNEPLTLMELSFLLWATQGIKQVIGKQRKATLRTVPSAGARHPLETYLFINHVETLKQGIYHYLPLEHQLEYLGCYENQTDLVAAAFSGQIFFAEAPVSFVWTAIPYRTEWRYTIQAAKYALLDAGHACENLYLSAEALQLGVCAIGAYIQEAADALLGLPSGPSSENDDEFVIYAACVGKPKSSN